ncbi:MAG: Ferrous iron transport periplasmic protein EfeO, contains peptidase-M75 domain and (frequently) cupredoxin-like domain [uncultured Corynebacteriales bacterium]|uniref:Ferrous iron transport periplasmic protein EfeO, contains peptidase-M75 domain and (Frequently) cupredoxin-like domain n=1 Tax=uncultured Mycobacteriales bacterium TaxID=581187 RepID=A0A6J4JYI5_9ACTN|nr:MAG: Ferrous iron transport periplasmic protein EfeO, contains peptidase-M75 domain and (frequently) cupredoxin-like domain [uncultured Corynebacteriales bacterium]
MRRSLSVLALSAALAVLAGCSDDGGQVRSEGGGSGSGSTGSGSGLSASDLGTQSSNQDVTAATNQYRTYVQGEVTALRAAAKKFTDAVRAGNVAEAKKQYAPSRVSWERIEPIAGLVEEIDVAVDARVDDFAGVDDPKWTGWHKLEYLLWKKNTTAGGAALATKLDTDLATLDTRLKTVDITPKAVALGAGALIEEVSEGKITGEEDRYSRTDLWDFAANVEGSKAAYTVFKPILAAKNPTLTTALDSGFTAVEGSLKPYQVAGGGYQSYTALKPADKTRMQAQLAALSEELAKVPAALGVA